MKLPWTFREVITAKNEHQAKRKFKKIIADKGVRRWDVKIISCRNTLQHPETFVIDYQGRKKHKKRSSR